MVEEATPRASEGLIVAGSPSPSSEALVAGLAADASLVVAVDSGVEVCRRAQVVPHLLVGDKDSASAESVAWARAEGVDELVLDVEKDETDLLVALGWMAERCERVTVTCASGGRADHALGVYGCLAQFARLSPRLVEDAFECRVLSTEGDAAWSLGDDAVGCTFSCLALAGEAVVSERGMRWELDRQTLACLSDLGVSNIVTSGGATIECHGGVVAAFLIR